MNTKDSASGSNWPTSAILLYGTLGNGASAGRRDHVRSALALVVLFFWMVILAHVKPPKPLLYAMSLVPGLVFMYIAWEFRRYLLALDELARRIHLESIAWTYLTGMALAMGLGGVSMVTNWHLHPLWFIVLEPVRAGWLYVQARRY